MFRCRFLCILPLLAFATMAYGVEPDVKPEVKPEVKSEAKSEGVSASPPVVVRDEFHLHEVELKLIERTNAERARFGLRPLAISRNLISSARRHTIYMCRSRLMVHSNQNLGENIAMGQPNVDTAIRTWMNSPGHRANILNPSYTQIGVAAYRLGSNPTIYWTQQFVR